MKRNKLFLILILLFLFLIPLYFNKTLNSGIASEKESQCIKCHTSAKKLIKITREIAKNRPVLKAESEGDG